MTFDQLYRDLLRRSVERGETPAPPPGYDPQHLECLLHPERFAPVWREGGCECGAEKPACVERCIFDAIVPDGSGGMMIDPALCTGCGACIEGCKAKKIAESRDAIACLDAMRHAKGPVYALVAPAFHGQFSPEVTPGMLRAALKKIGFDGMIEVALFADILTLKEALEFEKNIRTESDYQLTSCCCPIWIAMIRKIYRDLLPHVPGAVSPMIACGRTVKHIHPDALTVFIGPCLAKKAEAREPDVKGAVDYVLTFQEIRDILAFAGVNPANEEDHERDHSSRAGRIYARSGGVSEAVARTVRRLDPDRVIRVHTRQANGVPACRELMNELKEGKGDANFYEGMGCVGGCVGGPRAILDREKGRANVNAYGDSAPYQTPADNPYVVELLHRLGLDTVESLLEENGIFTRHF